MQGTKPHGELRLPLLHRLLNLMGDWLPMVVVNEVIRMRHDFLLKRLRHILLLRQPQPYRLGLRDTSAHMPLDDRDNLPWQPEVLRDFGAFDRMLHPLRPGPADIMQQRTGLDEPHISLGFTRDDDRKVADGLAMSDDL